MSPIVPAPRPERDEDPLEALYRAPVAFDPIDEHEAELYAALQRGLVVERRGDRVVIALRGPLPVSDETRRRMLARAADAVETSLEVAALRRERAAL